MDLVVLPYRVEEQSEERLVLHAIAADARLELSPGFAVFLEAFAQPKSLAAFIAEHADLDRDELEGGVATLMEQGLLVDAAFRDALRDLRFERSSTAAFAFERAPITALLRGDADAVFLGVPIDVATTGAPGARQGPSAIRLHTRQRSLENGRFIDEATGVVRRVSLGRTLDIGDLRTRAGEGIDTILPRIEHAAALAARTGGVVVAAGGDHSITYPLLRGLAGARRQRADARPLCLVHFDAHSDLPRGAWGPFDAKHSHASFMRHVLDDNLVERVVQIGLRAVMPAPAADVAPFSVEPTVIGATRAMTLERAALLAHVPTDHDVYITVDIDVIDPAYAPETGTPLPCGLTPARLAEMVSALCEERRLVGIDVTEVAGEATLHNRAAAIAAHVLHHALLRRFGEVER